MGGPTDKTELDRVTGNLPCRICIIDRADVGFLRHVVKTQPIFE